MMATVPHVTSGLGLTKFQADGLLLTRVYIHVYMQLILYLHIYCWWRSWLRHWATSRKVAGSISDGVIEIFH